MSGHRLWMPGVALGSTSSGLVRMSSVLKCCLRINDYVTVPGYLSTNVSLYTGVHVKSGWILRTHYWQHLLLGVVHCWPSGHHCGPFGCLVCTHPEAGSVVAVLSYRMRLDFLVGFLRSVLASLPLSLSWRTRCGPGSCWLAKSFHRGSSLWRAAARCLSSRVLSSVAFILCWHPSILHLYI